MTNNRNINNTDVSLSELVWDNRLHETTDQYLMDRLQDIEGSFQYATDLGSERKYAFYYNAVEEELILRDYIEDEIYGVIQILEADEKCEFPQAIKDEIASSVEEELRTKALTTRQ